MTEDGAALLRAVVLDSTGATDAVVTAPRATAPAIAMTTARFIVSLFMIISSRFCAPSIRRQISRSSPLTQRGTLLENEDERAKCRGSGSFTHSTGRGAVTLMLLIAARTNFSSLFYNFEKGALPETTCEPPYRSARPTQFGLSGRQRYVANGSCTVGWLWSDQCRFLIFGKK